MTRVLSRVNSGRPISDHERASGGQQPMGSSAFTIDDHHARTRHFDLRLMRQGSEALWAVASAIPSLGDQLQDAIRIEESPLTSNGGIATRSHRTAWDHGRMTVRMWWEGEAAVVTLHGTKGGGLGGRRTVSLRHVGCVGDDDDLWTIVAVAEPS